MRIVGLVSELLFDMKGVEVQDGGRWAESVLRARWFIFLANMLQNILDPQP